MSCARLTDRILARFATLHYSSKLRRMIAGFKRATALQDERLTRQITECADTAFGRDHHFASIRGYADFAANVPIRKYADLLPYLERVFAGESSALLPDAQSVLMFALTSGTTDKPKYIPVTPRVLADWRLGWNVWGSRAILDHPGTIVRHIVQVTSPMNDHASPDGVPCGAITGLLAATQSRLVRRYYVAPLAVADIKDSAAKYYTLMRLAIPKDVAFLVTANPSTLLLLAETADKHHARIIRDIHDGTLWGDLPVESNVRIALRPRIQPDRACARRLEQLVEQHGTLLPRHYWSLGFRAHWTGGTMGLYEPRFQRFFGDVPARDIGLLASEGRMSIPLNDGTASGVLAVYGQFFEFIPAEEYGTNQPTVLRSHELEAGREYFLVITNDSGLYRYDLGDRVRVTGWYEQAPLIEFLSRDAHTASLAGEKLTEDQVVAAMRSVATGIELGDRVFRFVCAPRWGSPPRYRLYVETATAQRIEGLGEQLDRALAEMNIEYASKRDSHRLDSIETTVLPDGSLAEREKKARAERSRTAEQFKQQYLLPQPGGDKELESLGNQL